MRPRPLLPFVLATTLLPLGACSVPVTTTAPFISTRSRILMLAGEEATLVPSHTERLARLLNIAHRQIQRSRGEDARITLRAARSTLQESPSLDEHARMAAWVSLSELWRRAGDLASAREAAADAERFLKGLEPVVRRAEYVRGLALELRYLDGDLNAAALLREGGQWAAALTEPSQRRRAFTAIAWDLFLCDDFQGGRDLLRRDADAAWRTDTLTILAGIRPNESALQPASAIFTGLTSGPSEHVRGAPRKVRSFTFQASSDSSTNAPDELRWGKSVNFEAVYLKPGPSRLIPRGR